MKVIAIANRKGGVGKTTTAAALTAELAHRGLRTLGIDLDAQCNFSQITRATDPKVNSLGVLYGDIPAADAIHHTDAGDIIPGSKALATADMKVKQPTQLREALEAISGKYDYCVLDCPPALGMLTMNGLTAADYVVIPAQADLLSLDGIQDILGTIQVVRQHTNPKLKVAGILLTRYQARANLTKQITDVMEQKAAAWKVRVFPARIREGVAVREAQALQQDLFTYAPKSNPAQDYMVFINELMQIVG